MKKSLGIKTEFWSATDSDSISFKNIFNGSCYWCIAEKLLSSLKIMKYYYHHCRPLEVMVQMLAKLFGINKMNKSHQKEKGKF